jgi:hypothetical protein
MAVIFLLYMGDGGGGFIDVVVVGVQEVGGDDLTTVDVVDRLLDHRSGVTRASAHVSPRREPFR